MKKDKLKDNQLDLFLGLPEKWIKHVDRSIPDNTEYLPTMSMRDIYERYTKGEVKLAFAATADYEGVELDDEKLDELHNRIDTTTMSDSEIYDIVSAQEEIINGPEPPEPSPAQGGDEPVDNLSDGSDTI